eukprot:361947-Chlamydomonas_euryale.AAC.13
MLRCSFQNVRLSFRPFVSGRGHMLFRWRGRGSFQGNQDRSRPYMGDSHNIGIQYHCFTETLNLQRQSPSHICVMQGNVSVSSK